MKTIRVLIVEDSAVVREHLRRIISADDKFQVVGMAASGEEAIQVVERLAPDVITMDIHLPGIQGLEATRQIMTLRPTPIVIVSGIDAQQANLTMQALRAGALSVVEKPVASTQAGYEAVAARLRTQLEIMSDVKVVRQREVNNRVSIAPPEIAEAPVSADYRILAIAASTGGPNALVQLLTGLGSQFPLPILLVQHMTPAFVVGFAEWLSSVTPFPVEVVKKTTPLCAGTIYVAAPGYHLIVKGLTASIDDRPPVGGHRPSATILFSSVARSFGASALGVVLTGMGDDGASGLCEMKAAGAFTIAEAESTAVVYGMPAAAVQVGSIRESHALGNIADRLLELVGARTENA